MLLLDLLLHDWTYSVLLFYQGILCWKAQKARERERDKEKKTQLFCLQLVTISFPANPRGFFNCLFSLRGRRIFSKQSITNSQIRDIWRCITSLDRRRKQKKSKKNGLELCWSRTQEQQSEINAIFCSNAASRRWIAALTCQRWSSVCCLSSQTHFNLCMNYIYWNIFYIS